MADRMEFPATFDEFAEQYKIVDKQEVYTNGTELIPIFRVKQWLEDNPDVISQGEAYKWYHEYHRIKDELEREKMYHRETERLADKYCAELQVAKSAVEKPMFENTNLILHALKRQIHEKAVRPHNAGIDAYIGLKVFDAILQGYLNKLE